MEIDLVLIGCALAASLSFGFWEKKQKKCVERLLQKKEQELLELKLLHAASEERLSQFKETQAKVEDTFKAFCWEALEKNSRSFLELAKTTLEKYQDHAKGDLEKRQQSITDIVTPMKEVLHKLEKNIQSIEKERKGEQEVIKDHLKTLVESERLLRQETSALVKALKAPTSRGRWGEIQLKRVVEIAGMLNYCDFYEQHTIEGEEGKLRPDLVVQLAGGRKVVVDAKVPLDAYLESMQTEDEKEKIEKLKLHAKQLRAHLISLSKKAYWDHIEQAPEFVILFLPAETFLSAALEYDPSLLENGAMQKVIIATPTTLIALLKAVAYGWKEENLSKHVEEVSILAQELYKRLIDMGGTWNKMGRSLGQAVESYNKAVGSLESRVFVTARKFKELGIVSSEIQWEGMDPLEKSPRQLQSAEFSNLGNDFQGL